MAKDWQSLEADAEGMRLDLFLAQKLSLSRARVQKLIEQGLVRRAGSPAKANHKVQVGEQIEYFLPPPEPLDLQPEAIPLQILYEDAALAVIEKPAGLVVHPAAGHAQGTLVNALLHHFTDLSQGIGGKIRPGIVHRIDRQTSGVLLITKTDEAHHALSAQFKAHSITRKYLGLAWGKLPPKGEWNDPIGRDPKDRKRMAAVPTGRTALTRFRTLEPLGNLSFFEAELFTGRTHQIRVHFSTHGFPLVGDAVYANALRSARQKRELGLKGLQKCPEALTLIQALQESGRQFLHAAHLGFTHPVSGQRLEFESDLPPELAAVMLSLRACTSSSRPS